MSDDEQKKDPKPKRQVVVTHGAPKRQSPKDLPDELKPQTSSAKAENPIDFGQMPEPSASSGQKTEAPKAEFRKSVHEPMPEAIMPQRAHEQTSRSTESTISEPESMSHQSDASSRSFTGTLLSLIALIGVGALGYWGYQTQEQIGHLRVELAKKDASISAMEKDQDLKVNTILDKAQLQTDTLNHLQSQLEVTQSRLNQIGGRNEWKLNEAQYLVNLAHERLKASGDVQTAKSQLVEADMRLRDLNDPSTTYVREAIKKDIARLNNVQLPDKEGLWAQIGSVKSQITELAFVQFESMETEQVNEPGNQAAQEEGASNKFKEAMAKSWEEIKGLIQVKDYDAKSLNAVLSSDEQAQLGRSISLLLEQARWGLVQENTTIYQQSLQSVKEWIEKYFAENQERKTALDNIDALMAADITTPQLEVTESMNAINHYIYQNQSSALFKSADTPASEKEAPAIPPETNNEEGQ